MTAELIDISHRRARLNAARATADKAIFSINELKPDTETAISGLITAIHDIASKTSQPGLRQRTITTLRSIASLLEEDELQASVMPATRLPLLP